jgi:hypothetical protein
MVLGGVKMMGIRAREMREKGKGGGEREGERGEGFS